MSTGIQKLLVANRGEIAIRVFRAAVELGIETVAVHTWEDRQSLHRLKADEAYQIGTAGRPLQPYLDIELILKAAQAAGADAIHPGYGFLSENPDLAQACADAGITFVGPPQSVLKLCGNKMRAQAAAAAAGLTVLNQSAEVTAETALTEAEKIGFPLFVKAASGGGGRGLRRISDPTLLVEAVATARREALSAFGDATVFLERAVTNPRHIEVQLIGDGTDVVHLFERDCSIQRRHQKVVELAPAPNLNKELRDQMCQQAVQFGQHIKYVNAGTVEFLLDENGEDFVFIEMNPRVQVEHTVTEETTDIDIVQTQLRIAGGETLAEMGLVQESIRQHGAALQCRITTEDPSSDFRPDTGRILAFRQPGGAGIRLDGGGGYAGAEITPYFDSLLTKLTCRGNTFDQAVGRARRALAEFRVRGPITNLSFLQSVLADPDFQAGRFTTSFIDERPHLMEGEVSGDRATRLLRWLGEVTVNRPHGLSPTELDPSTKLPPRTEVEPPPGSRQRLTELGPAGFAQWMRTQEQLLVTDTTLRDAHQSILATRVRTIDLVMGARQMASQTPNLLSAECWGGATFDVALRFLHEDPWERLERLRAALPNTCLQMLLRGRNTVGYTAYPDAVAEAFVREAHRTGIDIFRVFDALNNIDQMKPAINALQGTGALIEGTICYSGDLTSPNESIYTLDYYLGVAEALVEAGVHVLCVKDMAGLLRAPAARTLVTALRGRFDAPVHLHTHDSAGGQLATYLAAADAGVDAVDGAAAPLSGMTSQPALPAIVAAFANTTRDTGLSLSALTSMEPYWEAVRRLYQPFEAGLRSPTGSVYHHEIPGGQLSNLRQQAIAMGLGDRFEMIEEMYAACDALLGRVIKVTPTSKVVGDMALHLVGAGLTTADVAASPASVDLPDSVIGFLHGELGEPPGGFPEPFRTDALVGRRPAKDPVPLADDQIAALAEPTTVRTTLNKLLFPEPAADFERHLSSYGELSRLPTQMFLYGLEPGDKDIRIGLGKGVQLLVALDAIGEPDERGLRRVVFELNGQLRPIDVLDTSVKAGITAAEKADPANPGHVAAPFTGIASLKVAVGDTVTANTPLAIIEAMKMESVISAPISGTIERIAIAEISSVEPGDLIAVISPA
ncbi:MAG: pyruvate carboxylase [Acidimicrobiales bacterium]|nr:pyruvate carboxylase [Acidimicrobiales bacterium]